ncbi:retrovirus-related pol polyprotein from transposon TNT 1-94 [Tanacetum coccineum]|uniref:Retrovirus-related pol polyprotein from transposon TNT 1-94 n=1 Tax=Tanacetum coccineum TaxID=301880 RepID=A0ABQ5A6K4_9ASTR
MATFASAVVLDGIAHLESESVDRIFPIHYRTRLPHVKCKYVTRNTGKGHESEENTDSYEALRRNPYDSVMPLRHLSQHYGVTWTLDYAITSFKPAIWKVHVSSLRHKLLKGDLDEIEEVNANCILMANLQQASTSNANNVISAVSSVEKSGRTVDQNLATSEETRALYDSLFNNLAIEVENVNMVNCKMKETNAELTTKLARYKNQEKCFEINQEKYDKLERCYQKFVYQEQCLTKKINALHLSSAKTITSLNEEIANLNNQLSKEKSIVSSLQEEKKKSKGFVSQKAKSREEFYFSNISKAASVLKSISIPNEEFLDDTTPSVARKFLNEFLKEVAKVVRDFKSLIKEADESLAKHKALEFEIKRLLRAAVSQDIMSIVQSNPVDSEQKDITKGTSVNTKFANQSTERKLSLQSLRNNFGMRQPNAFQFERPKFSKTQVPPKVVETNDLSNPITSNSVPTTTESRVVTNDKVIAPGMFRINPFQTSREEKSMPNKPIKASTRRLKPRSSIKNDRVPSVSKSSCIKNKEVKVEEHHRDLLVSKNKKHMSSECNNIKLAIRNDKSEFVCAMYSRCSKHMKGNLKLLINFVWKFLGTVHFRIDHVAAILGYGDLQWGNILITKVYFVKGLGHNLFSVRQFCDSDLEVAFRRNTCFVKNLKGVDILKGNHTTNLYTINLHEMASTSPIYLMTRATYTKSWLWHQRLSHLNFDTINDLAKNDIVTDEAPEEIKIILKKITVLVQASVIIVRTDNGTEFKNQVLQEYFNSVGISHQASSVRTPQQKGVVEQRNWTLVEAARTMLIFFSCTILKEFDLLKWDQQVVSELVALRNFARRYGSRFCTHGGCIQSSHAQTGLEMLDQTFDRLQKLVSQLELLDKKLSQEDVNQKLLRSLSPEWNTHAVVWRNKVVLETMSMDDLYNNLKVYEPEVKGMSSSSSSTQNMAFVSSLNNNTSSSNEAVNTTHGVTTASTQVNTTYSTNIDNLSDAVICSFFASQPNSPQVAHEDL